MATIRLNKPGMLEMLQSAAVSSAVHAKAVAIASAVGPAYTAATGRTARVEVQGYTTDRSAFAVRIIEFRALSNEAKYGVLGKAAKATGIDFKKRKAAK